MSDLPKRRLIDQLGSSPTFVAEGCHLTGDVETGGPLVVCGAIRGDGRNDAFQQQAYRRPRR